MRPTTAATSRANSVGNRANGTESGDWWQPGFSVKRRGDAFGGEGPLRRRTRHHRVEKAAEVRPLARRIVHSTRPSAQHQQIGIDGAILRAEQKRACAGGQRRLDQVEHVADAALGMRLDLGRRGCIVGQAFGIEVEDECGLHGVGQVDEPLVEFCPLVAAKYRRQPRPGMAVGQMQADRRRLIERQPAIDEHRDAASRVELEVLGAFVFVLVAVDQHQLIFRTDFLQQDMRREIGIAGVIVELVHGSSSKLKWRGVPATDYAVNFGYPYGLDESLAPRRILTFLAAIQRISHVELETAQDNAARPSYRIGFTGQFSPKNSFDSMFTRTNVVRLVSSFSVRAPTYVHAERRPPRMFCTVLSTGPRYGTSTSLPSEAR